MKLSLGTGSDAQQAAASSLAENNAYIGKDEFSRIGDVIESVLGTPQTLDDYYLLASIADSAGQI